ncbi:MAG: beta-lactamase family protein [Bacilli bacterium]|jgi:CubicO group peptidase (beta-lactamase class C family)|nr:beta-lactamase family protein [Bacilli bacterium]
MEEKLNNILQTLMKNGSTFDREEMKRMKEEVRKVIKKDYGVHETLEVVTKDLIENSSKFIHLTNRVISGLSSCIYLPNLDGTYSITIFGGTTNYEGQVEIDEKTVFDLASITKLYTFVLTFSLIEKGFLRGEDKIKDLDSRFDSLGDYTVEQVLKMSGTIKTDGCVTDGRTEEEALKILETVYVSDTDFSYNNYTDFGFIVLSKVLEKVVSEKLGRFITFEEIMNEYLLLPWGLEETMFHPDRKKYQIAGNGNSEGLVHDPKARLLGGAVGSAGLFATSEGLKHLASNLFQVQNVNYSKLAGTIIYPNAKQNNKGYAGIYQKHPLGLDQTFVPNEYATGSFAHQGFTGSVAVFDPINRIHNSILVNSIKEGEPKKPEGYLKALTIYQTMLTKITLKAYLVNRYYEAIQKNENVKIMVRAK